MIVGYPACLWESVHAMLDFDINVSIVDKWVQIIMQHDVRGQDSHWYAHVCIVCWLHGCA